LSTFAERSKCHRRVADKRWQSTNAIYG